MKKFQLQIRIEQKESWRISQIENVEIPSGSTNVESASLLLTGKMENRSPVVYRRTRIFQSFSGHLNRFIRILRLSGRKEK
ncbi:MAG: hypothetical protein ACR2HG_10890 [Pyrinomonadaceae bacterium]